MKHSTSTPPFLSLRGLEGQSTSSVEWSLKCDSKPPPQQHYFSNSRLSPSTSSSETRRVSTTSSYSNSSSSGLSSISSSESLSSSVGIKTNDDTDDITESTSTLGEDDPIISFEALSLDTQNIQLCNAQTATRTGRALEAEPFLLLEGGKYRHHNRQIISEGSRREMKLLHLHEEDEKGPPIHSLNLELSFDQVDASSVSRRTDSHSVLSALAGKKVSQHDSISNRLIAIPFAFEYGNSSTRPILFSHEEKRQQQERTKCKKYSIKKSKNLARGTLSTERNAPQLSRTKRQRGGSDLTMTSATGVDDSSSGSTSRTASNHRKRRRINRNRAMGAEDFDSILLQINSTGLLYNF